MTSNDRRSAICSLPATPNISPTSGRCLRAMGRAGLQTFPTSQDIIDRVADGRLVLGLQHPWLLCRRSGAARPRSWARAAARLHGRRLARRRWCPRAAASPDLGARLPGLPDERARARRCLSEKLRLPSVSLEVSGDEQRARDAGRLGRPVAPGPGQPGRAGLSRSGQARSVCCALWRAGAGRATRP